MCSRLRQSIASPAAPEHPERVFMTMRFWLLPPQVYIRIPEELSVPDRSVGKDIEGDLLHVIVAVIEKDPAVIDQKGKDRCQIQQRSSRKDQYILQSGRTFFCQNMSL